jgi:hypothetical protein
VTAVAAAATLKKPPNMKRIPRSLTLLIDTAETFAPCGDLYKYVKLCGYDV